MLKNVAILGFLIGFAVSTGCNKGQKVRVEGEVIKISGTLPTLIQSSGALFGNESVKINGTSLVYTVRTTNGKIFTLNILEHSQIPRAALISRICLGTKVSFMVQLVTEKEAENDPTIGVGSIYSKDFLVRKPCIE